MLVPIFVVLVPIAVVLLAMSVAFVEMPEVLECDIAVFVETSL